MIKYLIWELQIYTKSTYEAVKNMEYNEKYFAKSANKLAMIMWMVLGIVFSITFGIEVVKHTRTVPYYIAFESFCWIPYLCGILPCANRILDFDCKYSRHFRTCYPHFIRHLFSRRYYCRLFGMRK